MKKRILMAGVVCAVGLVWADVPTITESSVTITQDSGSRQVCVNYELTGAAGIVTVDFVTNGVSIGAQNFCDAWGDVNMVVQPGARQIKWQPYKSWPGQLLTNELKAVVSAWITNRPPDYLCVSLDSVNASRYYVSAEAVPGGVSNEVYKTTKMLFRRIPAEGVTFTMGSPTTESGREPGGKETQHAVTLGRDFYLAIYPLTRGQAWNGAQVTPDGMYGVRWESELFTPFLNLKRLNTIRGEGGLTWSASNPTHEISGDSLLLRFRNLTGLAFDLPTEAQWEFACRAGTATALNSGKDYTFDNMHEIGWAGPAYESFVHNVGQKPPNAWGLYDMHGLAWEWCLDLYVADLGTEPVVDPLGGNTGTQRVLRGGGWRTAAQNCRSAARFGFEQSQTADQNDVGVRFALPIGGVAW